MYYIGTYTPSMKVKTRKLNRLLYAITWRLFATIRNMLEMSQNNKRNSACSKRWLGCPTSEERVNWGLCVTCSDMLHSWVCSRRSNCFLNKPKCEAQVFYIWISFRWSKIHGEFFYGGYFWPEFSYLAQFCQSNKFSSLVWQVMLIILCEFCL